MDRSELTPQPFPDVVAIGASAGGLQPLQTIFENAPDNAGICWIIVQHLSPDHPSQMQELLGRMTTMQVLRVDDGMPLTPDTVFLNRPRSDITVRDGQFRLTGAPADALPHHPIDALFESLATELGPSAIGVVLSGTGSDGARGLRSIRAAGGLALVQTPESAQFDGMPRAALAIGRVDATLSPSEIPDAIERFVEQCRDAEGDEGAAEQTDAEGVATLMGLLEAGFGIDFRQYKTGTIGRRIDRRILLSQSGSFARYVRRVETDPLELEHLYQDLLIGVTRFFRDEEVFHALEARVLPDLVAHAARESGELRIWAAACASGEEAYSLAILGLEEVARQGVAVGVTVFATDIHRPSLEVAGRGRYQAGVMEPVSSERRASWFVRDGDEWRVSVELRRSVVFAPHDLLTDPPFTRVDLVTCRNVLIYFRSAAQRRVLGCLHYALRVGGVMVLGASETPGPVEGEVDVVDMRRRIYRKRRAVRLVELGRRSSPATLGAQLPEPGAVSGRLALDRAVEALLAHYAPSCLVVDQWGCLVHTIGDVRRFLHPPAGKMSRDVLAMVDGPLRTVLSTSLRRARTEQKAVVYDGVEAEGRLLRVEVQPLGTPVGGGELLVVTMTERQEVAARAESGGAAAEAPEAPTEEVQVLRQELRQTQEHLQTTVEELEASNEELHAANEEMLASNEELQSTNEELQSVNEELHIVNSEHQQKISLLAAVTDDLNNLLRSTALGVLFLDEGLRVRRFTPAISRLFPLEPQDEGRMLDAFASRFDRTTAELVEAAQGVLQGGEPVELEVRHLDDGGWALLQIKPYLDERDRRRGAVMTLVDIDPLKRAMAELMVSEERFRLMAEHLQAVLWILGPGRDDVYMSPAFEQVHGMPASHIEGRKGLARIFETITESDHELVRQAQAALVAGQPIDVEYRIKRPDGRSRWLQTRGRQVVVEGVGTLRVGITEDVTERRQASEALQRTQRLQAVGQLAGGMAHEFNNLVQGIAGYAELAFDELGKEHPVREKLRLITQAADRAASVTRNLLGFSRKQPLRQELIHPEVTLHEIRELLRPVLPRTVELEVLAGPSVPIRADAHQIQQLLVNLCLNSRDALPDDQGRIRLTCGQELVRAGTDGLEPGMHAIFAVEDTGSGIPEDALERLFEPFFTTKPVGEGSGLGLAMAHGIVTQHGGAIRVESEVGRGSRFEVLIPAALADVKPARRKAALDDAPGGTETILVADDEETVRTLARLVLERAGYTVVDAKDGQEAVDLMTANGEEVRGAVLDIVMPRLGGREAAHQIRELVPGIPILFCTGYDPHTLGATEEPDTRFLYKPFRAHQLLRALRQVLDAAGQASAAPNPD